MDPAVRAKLLDTVDDRNPESPHPIGTILPKFLQFWNTTPSRIYIINSRRVQKARMKHGVPGASHGFGWIPSTWVLPEGPSTRASGPKYH